MTIEGGTAIVLAYVLVSMGVIIAFLLAAFVIGWFIGRLRQRRIVPGTPKGGDLTRPLSGGGT
jgi:biotin transporter BioY